MIDGKTLAKAVIWHQIKVWSIPVIIWLGSAYYFSSQKNFAVAELILWSPLLLIVLFQPGMMASNQGRKDADRDFDRIISDIRIRDANNYTFILNYFVDHQLKTEIKECTVPVGLARVRELQSLGYEISRAHYGFYKINQHRVEEVYKEAA